MTLVDERQASRIDLPVEERPEHEEVVAIGREGEA
jgi:hypothetical protein